MAYHASAWRNGQYVLKAADTDRAAIDTAELRAIQQCILRLHMPVPMKLVEDTAGVLCLREIHDKDAAFRCKHAPYFSRELLAHWPRQVVQHKRAQDHVTLRIGGYNGQERRCATH